MPFGPSEPFKAEAEVSSEFMANFFYKSRVNGVFFSYLGLFKNLYKNIKDLDSFFKFLKKFLINSDFFKFY